MMEGYNRGDYVNQCDGLAAFGVAVVGVGVSHGRRDGRSKPCSRRQEFVAFVG
jgi:hypothetical protein